MGPIRAGFAVTSWCSWIARRRHSLPCPRARTLLTTGEPPEEEEKPKRPPIEERADWTRHLPNIHRAIADCTRTSSSQPARAMRAFPMNRGLVNVLVRDASERDWDCIIRVSGGTPVRFDPLSATGLLRARPDEPSFLPLPAPPPVETECRELEILVEPETGRELGWILHPTCY